MPIPVQTVDKEFIFQDRLDPNGRLDFKANWEPTLSRDERSISTSQWILSTEATAIGVTIASMEHTNTKAIVWLEVAPASRTNSVYNGEGVAIAVLNRIEDNNPGMSRRYDRTFVVRLRHL